MSKKTSLTVMVVSHTGRKPTTLRVPVYMVHLFFIAIIFMLTYSYVSFYHYTYLKSENKTLQMVKSENEVLVNEYAKLYQDLETIKGKMVAIERLEEQVRNENEFDPKKSYFSKENQKALTQLKKVKVNASSVTETKETVDTLERLLPEKEKELESLMKKVEEKNISLLSIPSIHPTIGRITSPFGKRLDPFNKNEKFHEGVDIANTYRTRIYATADGIVIFSGRNGGYGNQIKISHGNGFITTYAHNAKNMVSKGDKVKKGQLIAYMGSTGRSTGAHLHYEVIRYGKYLNPMNYVDNNN